MLSSCSGVRGGYGAALIHHLSRGDAEHKFFYVTHEDELKQAYKDGFKWTQAVNKVEDTYKSIARKELTRV